MKLTTIFLLSLFLTIPAYADKQENKEPNTKKVCVDVQGKDGKSVIDPKTKKPKQQCTTVKVRQKHESTKVPEKK